MRGLQKWHSAFREPVQPHYGGPAPLDPLGEGHQVRRILSLFIFYFVVAWLFKAVWRRRSTRRRTQPKHISPRCAQTEPGSSTWAVHRRSLASRSCSKWLRCQFGVLSQRKKSRTQLVQDHLMERQGVPAAPL